MNYAFHLNLVELLYGYHHYLHKITNTACQLRSTCNTFRLPQYQKVKYEYYNVQLLWQVCPVVAD